MDLDLRSQVYALRSTVYRAAKFCLVYLVSLLFQRDLITCMCFFAPAFCFLFFRNNGISNLQEVEKLQVLPMLQALVLLDNPCSDESSYRLEVLVLLPHLQRLDKELVEEDERADANQIRQKRQEEEKVRTAWWGEEKEVKGKREDQIC